MLRPLFSLHPLERVALFSLGFAVLIVLVFPVPFYFPNGHSTVFVLEHYVVGLTLALLAATLFSAKRRDGMSLVALARNVAAFSLVVYCHFNFKLWAQLVNPHRFDDWYQWSDLLLWPLVDGVSLINLGFVPLKQWLPNAYHDIFVFMFFTSFAVHAITRSGRRCLSELVTAVALVLSLGGAAYMLAPAWGPFIYSPDEDAFSFHIQQGMSAFQSRFVLSAGQVYDGAEFISPLAAMPSLHVAHAWLLWGYAARYVRWLGYAYLPLVIFISTEAVVSRWHYVIDLAAGLCIAYLCVVISRKMHRRAGDPYV
ncbi:MAG: phosphatase PAP2 family protein [Betaproteobacteria bacterium]|nr:phosphatase PAP2 family protein [Betaproteobacteria bacterium]